MPTTSLFLKLTKTAGDFLTLEREVVGDRKIELARESCVNVIIVCFFSFYQEQWLNFYSNLYSRKCSSHFLDPKMTFMHSSNDR